MNARTLSILQPLAGLLLLFCLTAGDAVAYGAGRSDSIAFHFRQGESRLDREYAGNPAAIRRLNDLLTDTSSTKSNLKGISIIGAASPEGSVKLNENLSRRRAAEITKQFPGLLNLAKSAPEIIYEGRDWQGVRRLAVNDADVPYREEVIALLDEIIRNDAAAGEEKEDMKNLERLKQLREGVPYAYLYRRSFPEVRRSVLFLDYTLIPAPSFILTPPFTIASTPRPGAAAPALLHPALPAITDKRAGGATERNFYMGVKSNLLHDALALPSLGVEFYLGRNLSVAGNWTYGWWSNDRRHRYWRAYGGDLALRWWFGKRAHEKPLTGHHLGIFAGLTTYDFEFGGQGIMGGIPGGTLWDRNMKMGGIEYGYSLPIARRFNLDMTIGVGYLGGNYIKYVPTQTGYMWESTHTLKWFGPVKGEISLVWLIGHGNENRKGGK